MPITPVNITTSGADGAVTLTAQNVPAGLTFNDNGNGTGTLTGTLAAGTSGASPYAVIVEASDAGGNENSKVVTVAVTPAPRYPYDAGVADANSPTTVLTDYEPPSLLDTRGHAQAIAPDILAVGQRSQQNPSQIVDISDPANPVEIGSESWGASTNGTSGDSYRYAVDFAGQRLGVGGDASFKVFDISDPTNPALLNSTSNDAEGDVQFNGTYFLVQKAIGNATYYLYDADGVYIKQITDGGEVMGAEAQSFADDKLFLVDGGSGSKLHQYRFTADTPAAWATYTNPDISTGTATDSLVRVDSTHVARVTDSEALPTLHIYDLDVAEGSTDVSEVSSIALGGLTSAGYPGVSAIASPSQMVAADTNGLVYVSNYDDRFQIVDCSAPASPVLGASVDFGDARIITDMVITNGKLVVNSTNGITIYT